MENLIGVTELAEGLKVNKQTIYNWVSRKEIPFTKVGDLLRFDVNEIRRWVKNNTFVPDKIEYNGYEIEACPYQLAESKEWSLNIYIWKDHGSNIVSRNFSARNTFPTREEALKHCLRFGQRIIEGEIENCSVEGM